MSGARTITIGGRDYAVPAFTLGEVQRLLPLFKQETIETPAGMAALCTIVHIGVSKATPVTFDEFQAIGGVTLVELLTARNVIGRAIGYLAEEKPAPGEAAGEESP